MTWYSTLETWMNSTGSEIVARMTDAEKNETIHSWARLGLHHCGTRADLEGYVSFHVRRYLAQEIDQVKLNEEISSAREHWRKSTNYDGQD